MIVSDNDQRTISERPCGESIMNGDHISVTDALPGLNCTNCIFITQAEAYNLRLADSDCLAVQENVKLPSNRLKAYVYPSLLDTAL